MFSQLIIYIFTLPYIIVVSILRTLNHLKLVAFSVAVHVIVFSFPISMDINTLSFSLSVMVIKFSLFYRDRTDDSKFC